jgi:hypothetical protein
MLAETVWPHFWAVQILLLLLILLYCTIRELVRIIGRDRILAMFFGWGRTKRNDEAGHE